MNIRGGCFCGAVRYEVSSDPLVAIACHCRACQYAAGGAPTLVVAFPRAAFLITKGLAKAYWSVSDEGESVQRSFCETCGTPLYAKSERNKEFVAVKVGSLDDPSGFKVQMDLWRSAAQPWQAPHEGASQFQTNPR